MRRLRMTRLKISNSRMAVETVATTRLPMKTAEMGFDPRRMSARARPRAVAIAMIEVTMRNLAPELSE